MLIRSRARLPQVRLLDDRDLTAAGELLARDRIAHCFVASRIQAYGLDSWRLGAEVWGIEDGAGPGLRSMCFAGANLMPINATEPDLVAYAERARRQGRRCSSLVGPAAETMRLWRDLEPHWGPAREVRADQPLLAIEGPPLVEPDPLVREVTADEIDVLMPACIAMFTEEVGVSPIADGDELYRSKILDLIQAGRSLARIEGGQVVFKAEIGAVANGVCQVQGVWVDPQRRGEGIGLAGSAAIVTLARLHAAPVVSLYVNAFNHTAREIYQRVGFRQVGTYASVLF